MWTERVDILRYSNTVLQCCSVTVLRSTVASPLSSYVIVKLVLYANYSHTLLFLMLLAHYCIWKLSYCYQVTE